MVEVEVAELRTRLARLLEGHGLSPADAAAAGEGLVEAELMGRPAHGLRTLPHLLAMVETRRAPACRLLREAGAAMLLDASGRPGPLAARECARLAAHLARAHGVGLALARETGPVGVLSAWARPLAAEQDLLALVLASTPRAVVPHGGREGLLGTNPFCLAAPAPGEPLLVDFACASLSYSRLASARERGEALPEGCALDPRGEPTTDSAEAMRDGVRLLPFGGHRGSALAFALEVLVAGLTGGPVGRDKSSGFEPGHFSLLVLAVDPGALGVDLPALVAALREDLGETRYPGEASSRRRAEALARGTVSLEESSWRLLAEAT